jgi:GntR family transcriptional repressor for pyruvate dehydrogenase complex
MRVAYSRDEGQSPVSALRPIKQEKVYQAAMNQLLALIDDGTFSAGDRLPTERQLAEQLGISRASVRQALTGMAALGIVESRPGDGSYVATRADSMWRVDAASALEILEARRVVEAGTARLAAIRRTDDDIAALTEIVRLMDDQVAAGGNPVDTDREFHRAIGVAAHNQFLQQAMGALADQMSGPEWQRIKIWGLHGPEHSIRIQEQHRMLFQAIRDGKPEAAEAAMRMHIDRIVDDVHAAEAAMASGAAPPNPNGTTGQAAPALAGADSPPRR